MLSCFSFVWLFVTPWTVVHQAPLSIGFSRQEYWSGFPCPPPRDLPNPGIDPVSLSLLHWWAGSLPLVPPGNPILVAPILTFKLCDIFTENTPVNFLLAQLIWSLPHCHGLQALLASSLCSINSGFLPAPKTCSIYSRCLHFLLLLVYILYIYIYMYIYNYTHTYIFTGIPGTYCVSGSRLLNKVNIAIRGVTWVLFVSQ